MSKCEHHPGIIGVYCLHLIILKIFKINFTCFICYITKLACGYQILE